MAEKNGNVLKTALPPATDYLTYLTILEYNLKKEDLSLLQEILQDEKLVVNIGWDLVQILLPLLPDSRGCLEAVAVRGNPREVILKVTEELDRLGLCADDEVDVSEEDALSKDEDRVLQKDNRTTESFQALLHMLCILHSRIQTKKPSRFLETSVTAIVSACKRIASSEEVVRASLMFVRAMSGSSKPSLPPRGGEIPIPSVSKYPSLPDPEGDGASKADGEEGATVQLLRILISYVLESYLDSSGEKHPQSPMHWTERHMQKAHLDFLTSHRAEETKSLGTASLLARETTVKQIVDTATIELKMTWRLIQDALDEDQINADADRDLADEQLTISKQGALYLLTALKGRSFKTPEAQRGQVLTFQDHDRITTAILGDPQVSLDTNVPMATVDALIRLGWAMIEEGGFQFDGNTKRDEAYNMYLQKFSALAATQVSSELRYQIFLFTNHVLKAHPSSEARWSFLRDTYRFCPFTSLKELAVIWVKDEYVRIAELLTKQKETSIDCFAQPSTLRQLLSELYTVDRDDLTPGLVAAQEHFFQACLSLIYLLCASEVLRNHLDISAAIRDTRVDRYLTQLETTILETLSQATTTREEELSLLGLNVLRHNIAMAQEGLSIVKKHDEMNE